MIKNVVAHVIATVRAPYGTDLSAAQLAAKIADPKSAKELNGPVFTFFSEVSATAQKQFLEVMGVDLDQTSKVARQFATLSGYTLPLAT